MRVRIGDAELGATASGGTFEVPAGELSLAPGSSGWTLPDDSEERWVEIFLRGGSAWEAHGRSAVGASIEVWSDAQQVDEPWRA